MNQKLFISDIDGTLLQSGCRPHPDVLDAAARFERAGGLLCLSTGRALPAVRSLAALLPACPLAILCGGALVYDFRERKPLFSCHMDADAVSALRKIIEQDPSISVTVSTDSGIYRIHDNECLLRKGVYEDRTAPQASLDQVGPLLKVLFSCDEPKRIEDAASRYLSPEKFQLHRASTHFYELTAAGVNKASGIAVIAHLLQGYRIFSAGDAPADIPMAAVSELFFAPQTASESVRSIADHIFPPPQEGASPGHWTMFGN